MLLFDEMAHMVSAGANRSAEEIFAAATPALAQFRDFSMLVELSSPAGKSGQFYDNAQYALRLDPSGAASHPTSLMVQLPTEDIYLDFERTHAPGFLTPGGKPFPRIEHALVGRDDPELVRRREQDPRGADNEFGAQWLTVENAFLNPDHVQRIFQPPAAGPLRVAAADSSISSTSCTSTPPVGPPTSQQPSHIPNTATASTHSHT